MKAQFLLILFFASLFSYSQHKQANTGGSEIIADVPYRIQKFNNSGQLNSVPILFYVHDSNSSLYRNDLVSVSVYVKNADTSRFTVPINLSSYSDADVQKMITCRSVGDQSMSIQTFDSSCFVKDNNVTLKFIEDTNWWFQPVACVQITRNHWYFMLNIPGEMLQEYNDIIDIAVEFNLDYDADETKYFRVFRHNDQLPVQEDWYKGDTHFHSVFTQNNAETGLPNEANRIAAKAVGLDWITITDHSCDFDNYGSGMAINWQKLGQDVATQEVLDSTFKFIRAIEMSVNNSAGDVVHALVYPSYEQPQNLDYLGDGGGDLISTNVSSAELFDALSIKRSFSYLAHPFAEGDVISAAVGGGAWNISDSDFRNSQTVFNTGGAIKCNDTTIASDIFSTDTTSFFIPNIIGGEIFNSRNSLQTADEAYNPWDVTNNSTVSFASTDSSAMLHYMKRLKENFEVTEYLWQKSLRKKNQNPDLKNWKFFLAAGSDAHGSFNYSNTDFTMELTGSVNENALGMVYTAAYCPNGMGEGGSEVLYALKHGHTVISDGPLLTMRISTDTLLSKGGIIIGQDTVIGESDLSNYYLILNLSNSSLFGTVKYVRVNVFDGIEKKILNISMNGAVKVIPMSDIITNYSGDIILNKYTIITAEVETEKQFESLSSVYLKEKDVFRCYTNPIYLKIDQTLSVKPENIDAKLYPNPARDIFKIQVTEKSADSEIKIFDVTMREVFCKKEAFRNSETIEIKMPESLYSSGVYFVLVRLNYLSSVYKLIRQ